MGKKATRNSSIEQLQKDHETESAFTADEQKKKNQKNKS